MIAALSHPFLKQNHYHEDFLFCCSSTFSFAALVQQFVLFALLVDSSVASSDESIQHQRRSVYAAGEAPLSEEDIITSARDATGPIRDIARKLKKTKKAKG